MNVETLPDDVGLLSGALFRDRILGRDQIHGPFRQSRDRQRGIDAGIRRDRRTVNHVEPWIVEHLVSVVDDAGFR